MAIIRGSSIVKRNTDLIPEIKAETDKIPEIKTETDKITGIESDIESCLDKIEEIKNNFDIIPDIKEETDKIPDIKSETDKIEDIKTNTDAIADIKANTDIIPALEGEINKIDSAATDGLLGISDSISYRVHEIEKHFHGYERWLGKAIAPSGEIHVADKIDVGVLAFQIDAGNNNWGAWVQILGSSDTPVIEGSVKFDLHRIQVSAAERTSLYFIQIAFGNTGNGGYGAGNYSSLVFSPQSVQGKPAPVEIMMIRLATGTKGWARCLCPGQNTATLDFFIGLHEYEG